MTKFRDAELQVMKLLLSHGEMKPMELQELHATAVKNSALRFTLSTLVEKGHIKRRQIGKAYHLSLIHI